MKTISRTLVLLSMVALTSVLISAQETSQSIRDKFLKQPTVTKPVAKSNDFFKPFGAGFYLSTAVCVGGAVADISTSLNGQELNPILRNRNGGLNVGLAILLKGSTCAWPMLVERKHPKLAFWARMAAGIAWGLVAMRN